MFLSSSPNTNHDGIDFHGKGSLGLRTTLHLVAGRVGLGGEAFILAVDFRRERGSGRTARERNHTGNEDRPEPMDESETATQAFQEILPS